MILIDAGYLIAVADARDQLHGRALAWARSWKDSTVVTEYVLLETVNYFSRIADRARIHALVAAIRAETRSRVISANPELFDAGLKLHASRPDKEWSLTDCISFCVMQEHGIRQALAYDAHFEQAGFEALLRRDPP